LLVAGWVALATTPSAASPVLHEYFEPSPSEDLELEAKVAGGNLAAAVANGGEIVTAPDPDRSPRDSTTFYSEQQGGEAAPARFQIDRDTRAPDRLTYHEPFVPSIAPFKRTWAYDAVDERFELVVAQQRLDSLSSGASVHEGDDQFFGTFAVATVADVPIRIPSVGPDARIIGLATSPSTRVEVLHDGADNWFVRAPTSGEVRLTLQLAIDHQSFGTHLGDPSWEELQPLVAPVPPAVLDATATVLGRIGVSRRLRPRDAATQLVAWFRGFTPTADFPQANLGRDLYLDLALSRKGVCRHRAYAFVVTALGLGLPARMALNEAHAWVEVHDGQRWHRIDLGGAAGELDYRSEAPTVPHRPPRDELPWPQQARPGEEVGRRAVEGAQGAAPAGPSPSTSPSVEPPAIPSDPRAPTPEMILLSAEDVVQRGRSFHLSGKAAPAPPCGELRVDVVLVDEQGDERFLQAIAADSDGRFSADVSVPVDLRAGDYRLRLKTPGSSKCSPTPSAPSDAPSR